MHSPVVTAVILNTNRRQDTLACLQSLKNSDYPNLKLLVLDNASSDGSVEAIRERFPLVSLFELPQNRGYAGNNNIGIKLAVERGSDWIFIINEDTVFEPETVSRLIQAAQSDPSVGIVGPMVYHHDEPGVIQSAGGILDRNWRSTHRGQNEADRGQYSRNEKVDWISGCALLVRSEVVRSIGVLDERFFYYWEETEWCLRARLHGWKILFVPGAKITHKGVQRDYRPGSNVTYYWTRNWLLTLAKHHAPFHAWMSACVWILRNLITWTLKPGWQSKEGHRQAIISGTVDFIAKRWGMRPG
jgi:hypothetical protein